MTTTTINLEKILDMEDSGKLANFLSELDKPTQPVNRSEYPQGMDYI